MSLENLCRGCMGELGTGAKRSLRVAKVRTLFEECTRQEIVLVASSPASICNSCYFRCIQWDQFRSMCTETTKRIDSFLLPEEEDPVDLVPEQPLTPKQGPTYEEQEHEQGTDAPEEHLEEEILTDENQEIEDQRQQQQISIEEEFVEVEVEEEEKEHQEESYEETTYVQQDAEMFEEEIVEVAPPPPPPPKIDGRKRRSMGPATAAIYLKCEHCGKYILEKKLAKHKATHFQCKDCDMTFATESQLQGHSRVHMKRKDTDEESYRPSSRIKYN